MELEKLAVLTNLQMISIAYLLLDESMSGLSLGESYIIQDPNSSSYLMNIEYHSYQNNDIVTVIIDQYGVVDNENS
jgi:hypothetical protein